MEYGENDDAPDGVTKWPFYLSALFILALVLGFAYLHLQENNTLDQWQLTTCILASGLASILVFIPHLLDRFLYLVFDPANRKDEELHRKTYFDIKEMRGDLESLAVKIDKVPAVVDKILSDSVAKAEDTGPVLDKLATDLEETREELLEKLGKLLEVSEHPPLLPEPDPAIAQANEAIGKLKNSLQSVAGQLKELQKTVDKLPTEFPEPVASPVPEPVSPEPEEEEEPEDESTEEIEEETELEPETSEDGIEAEEEEADSEPILEEEEIEPLADDSSEEDQREEELVDETEEEEASPLKDDEAETMAEEEEPEPAAEEPEEEDPAEEEVDPVPPEPVEAEETSEAEGQTGELELDLPDPEETLRKVDALLAGEDESDDPEPDTKEKPKSSKTGSTSVVANVMIGIGNKPYLRGEGAGLSWDEGVPMNFIEIGKWAWTPTRKNAALTVQVYRNDEDPDNGGKIEVKSGEEIEITPDFG
tara:strand:- start:2311 stop:3744 length:1434 start_codon:yes stop_codon:yes gene_type:complete